MKFAACFLLAILAVPSTFAQERNDYMGARAVLRKRSTPPGGSTLSDPKVVLGDDIAAFGNRVAGLAPEMAGKEWLDLVRRCFEQSDAEKQGYGTSQFAKALMALPSPDSWPLIERLISEGQTGGSARHKAMVVLMQVLQGKNQAAASSLKALPQTSDRPSSRFEFQEVELALALKMRDPDAIESVLRAKAIDQSESARYRMRSGPSLEIPDIVAILGEERADRLLTYILATAKAELSFDNFRWYAASGSGLTVALARKVVAREREHVAWPQWTLASTPETGNLFETFRKRFPKVQMGIAMDNPPSWSTYQGAAACCFVNLVLSGNSKRAREFGATYKDTLGFGWGRPDGAVLEPLRRAGKLGLFFGLLTGLALEQPDSRLPYFLMSFADELGSERTIPFLKKLLTLKTQDYQTSWARSELRRIYLRQGLAPSAEMLLPPGQEDEGMSYEGSWNAKQLFALASPKNPKMIARALDLAEASFKSSFPDLDETLLSQLLAHGRGPKLEKILIDRLREAMKQGGSSSPPADQSAGLLLAEFYYRIGRFRDVVTLLEKFTGWGAEDLGYLQGQGGPSVQCMAATALAKVGRTQEAEKILRRDLAMNPGEDAPYALVLEIDRHHAAEILAQLEAEHPYEPRPLIWTGIWLLRSGKLHEAESAIRRAIALDPNDIASWGQVSRFKAYDALADVKQAQGHEQEAKHLQAYAVASRLAKEASGFESVGLCSKAIAQYRKELAVLPNDFRSRIQLAVNLFKVGKAVEGAREIDLAFRQVPARLGKADSYFGYELMSLARAWTPAKLALEAQVAKATRNPGVYLALGQISGMLDDPIGAVKNYEIAVKFDPDSLAGWQGLTAFDDLLTPQLHLLTNAALIRLRAPIPSYFTGDSTLDYRQSWLDSAKISANRKAVSRLIFDLPASRVQLEKTTNSDYITNRLGELWEAGFEPPANRLSGDQLIRSIAQLVDTLRP